MVGETTPVLEYLASILLFPTFFQEAFIAFSWGTGNPMWLLLGKRLFLLLPVMAIILGCWVSIASLLTVIFRHERKEFVMSLFVTWWDLGKAIVSFWGGIFNFVAFLAVAIVGFIKIFLLSLWSIVVNILFMPFRLLRQAGKNLVKADIPWIAVFLTLFWCLIEATIFTYVMTPLVLDTFSNITGEVLAIPVLRIPLFTFLFFIVLGSYAVLATFMDSVEEKDFKSIIGIGVIEIVVLMVEVLFLYREFVDSLVPWFAQYSANFDISMFGILGISIFVWFGIRSLSWFLFAAHGTPTIMAVIHGEGLELKEESEEKAVQTRAFFEFSADFMDDIKEDTAWIQSKGEQLLEAFMLPPLQVIAAALNFCALLVAGRHLFELPLQSIRDIKTSKALMEDYTTGAEQEPASNA